jgi:hypothetical protein
MSVALYNKLCSPLNDGILPGFDQDPLKSAGAFKICYKCVQEAKCTVDTLSGPNNTYNVGKDCPLFEACMKKTLSEEFNQLNTSFINLSRNSLSSYKKCMQKNNRCVILHT